MWGPHDGHLCVPKSTIWFGPVVLNGNVTRPERLSHTWGETPINHLYILGHPGGCCSFSHHLLRWLRPLKSLLQRVSSLGERWPLCFNFPKCTLQRHWCPTGFRWTLHVPDGLELRRKPTWHGRFHWRSWKPFVCPSLGEPRRCLFWIAS